MKYVALEKYLSPPGIEESRREMWMLFSNENEIQFCSETNPCQHFPGIEEVSELLWDFEVVFRHFVTKLSESKLPHPSDHVRGRANQPFSVRFSEFSVRGGPSKILHPLQRGCQTRLTIRNKSKTNLMVRRAGLSTFLKFLQFITMFKYNDIIS